MRQFSWLGVRSIFCAGFGLWLSIIVSEVKKRQCIRTRNILFCLNNTVNKLFLLWLKIANVCIAAPTSFNYTLTFFRTRIINHLFIYLKLPNATFIRVYMNYTWTHHVIHFIRKFRSSLSILFYFAPYSIMAKLTRDRIRSLLTHQMKLTSYFQKSSTHVRSETHHSMHRTTKFSVHTARFRHFLYDESVSVNGLCHFSMIFTQFSMVLLRTKVFLLLCFSTLKIIVISTSTHEIPVTLLFCSRKSDKNISILK